MDIIQNDLNKLYSQFISIDDLVYLLQRIQPKSNKESIIHWLLFQKESLKKVKFLIFMNECEIIEYTENNQYKLPSPLELLERMRESHNFINMHSEIVGFAKQRLLIELKNLNIPIPDSDIKSTSPYLPVALTQPKTDEMSYIFAIFQDIQIFHNNAGKEPQHTNMDRYPPKLQAAIDAHRRINILSNYAGERGTKKKVESFLEDHYPIYKGNALLEKAITTLINSVVEEYINTTDTTYIDNNVATKIKDIGFKEHFNKTKKEQTF